VPTIGRSQFAVGRISFTVYNKKFAVPITGNSSKEVGVEWFLQAGRGRFNAISLYFPADQGIQLMDTRSLQLRSTATSSRFSGALSRASPNSPAETRNRALN
jgi:hypothetical protein